MTSHSFYTPQELAGFGFKNIGQEVKVSKYARFYNQQEISIGDNVRIDDFCILSGKIDIGSNIHISAYCALYGTYGIILEDYSGLSPRTTIFTASDDFSGEYLVGPQNSKEFTNVKTGNVSIGKYVQVGSNTIILPEITIHEGAAVGAMSLVNRSIPEWSVYAGIPAKFIKHRSKNMLRFIK